MEKLSNEERQAIVLSAKLDNSKENIQKLCNEYNITRQYVYKLLRKDVKEGSSSIIEGSSEFTKKANHIIELVFDRLEKELENNEKITLSQLSTTLGILYDKSRLEQNLSTDNKAININIKVEK